MHICTVKQHISRRIQHRIRIKKTQILIQLLRLLFAHLKLGFLNQGKDITHSKDSRSHTVRIKLFQIGELLAHTDVEDRFSRHGTDR